MSTVAPAVLGTPRHPDEARVSRRATIAFTIVLLAALAGAGVLLAHTIRQQYESRVSARLEVGLQAALSEAAAEADRAQQQAAALAADPKLQHALARHDRRAIARLVAGVPGAQAVAGDGDVLGSTQPALRREVRVLAGGRRLGTVAVTVPLDGAALARLRAAAPLAAGEGLLFVQRDRIVAGPSSVGGDRVRPHATSATLAGQDYRVVQSPLLGGPTGVRVAALAPASEIEGPVSHAEWLLGLCLAATLAALLMLARLLARPILIPLTQLAREARSSSTDYLTDLPNRRAFTKAAGAELARARRSGHSVAVALVDIDNFKQINDTFGHAAGDQVLRGVADVLRHEFREIDVVARQGGEEFAVLLPETDADGAREAAERFVVALARHEFGDGHTLPRGITASAGVAAGAGTLDGLLDAADRALYRAKENGKNQVQTELLAGGEGATTD